MVEWQSLFSSAISMKASPLKVVSVFVGDAGDGGVFSSVNVSPVIVRGGVIARQKGKRDPHGSEEKKMGEFFAHNEKSLKQALRVRCG